MTATVLNKWSDVTHRFDSLEPSRYRVDQGGDGFEDGWVFRGHADVEYDLSPTIERRSRGGNWAETELKLLREFRARAGNVMNAVDIPGSGETLEWLALMQHHGVPTRLLDFTWSPYVALYFALRSRSDATVKCEIESPVDIWALRAGELYTQSGKILTKAMQMERQRRGEPPPAAASLNPMDYLPLTEVVRQEWAWSQRLVEAALRPTPVFGYHFNRKGFVTLGLPVRHNRRLSSQQALFLVNGADELTLQESLTRMMGIWTDTWCIRLRISPEALQGAEERLFRMNIHDLSLFPDVEGLAGYIRQRLWLGM